MAQMTALRRRMIDDMTVRRRSLGGFPTLHPRNWQPGFDVIQVEVCPISCNDQQTAAHYLFSVDRGMI